MAIQGFDKEFYLNAKLAQLQSDSATAADWAGKDAAFLEARFSAVGLTAEQHYEQYGYQEDLAPNAFFNPAEYIRAKATAMFNDTDSNYLTIDAAAEAFVNLWGGNVYNHYLQYGEDEGINPSNSFDVSGYYEAKLAQLQAEGNTEITTVEQVKEAFEAAGLTALEHFLTYGQTEEGLSAPAVPADEQVNVDTSVPGQVFTLTTGVDNLTGTNGNDTFNASWNTAASNPLGGLDKIDGGAGVDTLNIADTATAAGADFALPAGFTVTNVEKMSVTTNGGLGATASRFDVSGITGLTDVTLVAAGAGAVAGNFINAADTTNLTLTSSGANASDITGGKAVTVNAGTGVVSVSGSKLESVSVKGGNLNAANSIDNGATGTTLKAVTLDNIAAGAAATIRGNAVETLTIKNQDSAVDAQITNTASKALTVNLENSGYTSAGGAVTNVDFTAGSAAETVTINTASKSNVTMNAGGAEKTVNLAGAGDLILGGLGAITTITKIDGASATGGLTLGALNAAAVTVSTGSGKDSLTLNATAKATVATGAGDDTVTLSSALAAGSTINLGDGNDRLLSDGTGSVAASTAGNTTVIDGGAGIDAVSSALINVGNAAQFVNFEQVSLGGGNLDLNLLTGSTITGLSIDGTATTTVSNATAAQSLTVNASGNSSTIGFTGVGGSSDAYSINFNASTTGTAAAPTTVNAGTVVVNGIENLTVNSGSAAGVNANSITLTDSTLQTLTITGDQAATVAFTGTNGTIASGVGGVSLIDGSAATGKLNIDVENVTAASGGITVKGGSAADTLTTFDFATTLTGNGGNDNFVVSDAVAKTADASTAVITTITDFAQGDTITFASTTGTTNFTSAKVDVSAAANLDSALNLATNANVTAGNAEVKWFEFGTDTYVVQDLSTDTELAATDVVVKLTGLIDLSTASVTTGTGVDVLSLA